MRHRPNARPCGGRAGIPVTDVGAFSARWRGRLVRTVLMAVSMRDRTYEHEPPYTWIVNALAILMLGLLGGYLIASQAGRSTPPAVASTTSAVGGPTPTVLDEGMLRAYREILERDPKNLQAAVNAGNLLYDAQRYAEAIGFYQQAFALSPSDINICTDLGTALWYAGRADEALAQYDKSLAVNSTHPQTLFNVGIVKADGKHDYAGAIAAWEKLLSTNPDYGNVERVRSLIAGARQKVVVAEPQ